MPRLYLNGKFISNNPVHVARMNQIADVAIVYVAENCQDKARG